MSSNWGSRIRLQIFGESHGQAIGAVLDGLPAGIAISKEQIEADMRRRMPRAVAGSTARREADQPVILSGVRNGKTTGSPLAMMIKNSDQHSGDYESLADVPRPAHADYTAWIKYGGMADMRGGGHFSGRLTAPLVFAGAVARSYLAQKGVFVGAHLLRIGVAQDMPFDPLGVDAAQLKNLYEMDFPVICAAAADVMKGEIETARMGRDSVGGVVECAAVGLPAGLGEPMLEGVEAKVASLLFGIPAVKGVEFGDGFSLAQKHGSEANDPMGIEDGAAVFRSNHAGGILGGITTGAPLIVRTAFKPTPSISLPQRTVNLRTMQEEELVIRGRHDSCIAVRGLAAVEAAVLLALMDLSLEVSA